MRRAVANRIPGAMVGGMGQPGEGGGAARSRGSSAAGLPEDHQLRSGWMQSVMDGIETDGKFVFKVLMRSVGAIFTGVIIVVMLCGVVSYMQEELKW